ncbi:MAG: beta-ketoacyl-[acyl-carrier-protein] synthase family protein [Oscillospiraceae bacterium]|nr:beta-ketoacyl-[acyl-carrier-protein] synthase family protein [Oscillospiraceae bacterium]
MERIVITGMGAVTPLGIGVAEYWENLIAGRCGVGRITRFDAQALAVQIAGEVPAFNPAKLLPKHLIRETDAFMQYAFVAAQEALAGAALCPARTGIVMGTGMNGIATIAGTQDALTSASHKKVGPRFVPKILGNIAAAQIAIANDIRGPNYTVSTACASGGDAVSMACLLLRAGKADAMLAVGAESVLCPLVLYSLSNAQALSRRNDDPQRASRPFDAARDGMVIGEGGGALLLETESGARARGAPIYGAVLGCGNNSDAHHVTAPLPSGEGAAACMRLALADARLSPADVGYINAHGTGTLLGDVAETLAIRQVFPSPPPVSSTKGATGHMMGAGGITELIACVKAIETGILPPTQNLDSPGAGCDLDYIPKQARHAAISAAMSNAFGFGGQNSSVIIGACK